MYRLQIFHQRRWKWGIREYKTLDEAKKRVETLKEVGIQARIKLNAELYK